MDFIQEMGALALGSRLRRLSDRLMQDGNRIYKNSGLDFEPKWFPVYRLLLDHGPSAVTEIAKVLRITHPSVNQIAKEMIAAGLLATYKDTQDKRRRVLALTSQAKSRVTEMKAVWQDVEAALQGIIDATDVDFLAYLETMERALDKQSFLSRFDERRIFESEEVEVESFDMKYAADFKRINEAWILEYFELEESDSKALDNPQAYIIEPGGDILFAIERSSGRVLGTCALINRGDGVAELAKMGVDKAARGLGVGKLIAFSALSRAREMGFKQLYLETNARLAPAIGLYRLLGFVRKPSPFNSDYIRSNVYMEMDL